MLFEYSPDSLHGVPWEGGGREVWDQSRRWSSRLAWHRQKAETCTRTFSLIWYNLISLYTQWNEPILYDCYMYGKVVVRQIVVDDNTINNWDSGLSRVQVTVVAKIYWGDARDKLCEAAVDLKLDCLVMGSRGLGTIQRLNCYFMILV